jgi:hypothetical protein
MAEWWSCPRFSMHMRMHMCMCMCMCMYANNARNGYALAALTTCDVHTCVGRGWPWQSARRTPRARPGL